MQNTDLNAIDALISELNSQIIRLPAADPEMVEKMLTALSIKLDNLAQEVRDQKSIDRQALQQAQVLLGVYSQQLAKAMARVQRGLEIFNRFSPARRDSSLALHCLVSSSKPDPAANANAKSSRPGAISRGRRLQVKSFSAPRSRDTA